MLLVLLAGQMQCSIDHLPCEKANLRLLQERNKIHVEPDSQIVDYVYLRPKIHPNQIGFPVLGYKSFFVLKDHFAGVESRDFLTYYYNALYGYADGAGNNVYPPLKRRQSDLHF